MARNYNRNNTQWENTAPVNRDGEMTFGRFFNRFTGNMETGGQRILPNSEQLVDNAIGLGEGALALGSSVALEPVAGLSGLLGLVNGDVDNAVNNIDKVRALGYQPRSKVLAEKLRNIEPTANAAMRFVDDAAVGVENWTGIPREVVKAVPIMGAELFGGAGVLKSANRFLNPDNLNASSVPSNFGQSGAIAGLENNPNLPLENDLPSSIENTNFPFSEGFVYPSILKTPKRTAKITEKENAIINTASEFFVGPNPIVKRNGVKKEKKRLNVTNDEMKKLITNVKNYRKTHSPKDGWEDFQIVSLKRTESGEIVPNYKSKPMLGNPSGKAHTPSTRKKVVNKISKNLVKEANEIVVKAKSGNQNAAFQLQQINWYSDVAKKMKELFPETGEAKKYAEIQAGMSPNTELSQQFKYADDFFHRAINGDFDDILKGVDKYLASGGKWAELPEELIPLRINGKKYGMNGVNGLKVLKDAFDKLEPKQAPKMRNFAKNLIASGHAATIDVWAGRTAVRLNGDRRLIPELNKVEGQIGVPGETGRGAWKNVVKPDITGPYGIASDAFSKAAKELNINPDDLQALMWFKEKELWESNGWTPIQEKASLIKLLDDKYGTTTKTAPRTPQDEFVLNATYEQTPGVDTGNLVGIADLPFDQRSKFENEANWKNSLGNDLLYSDIGVATLPTTNMMGAFRVDGGEMQYNEGKVARPLVALDGQLGERTINPNSLETVSAVENLRGAVDAQSASAANKVIVGNTNPNFPGVNIDAKNVTQEQMKSLADLGDEYGFYPSDTGDGVNMINNQYSKIGAARTGSSLNAELRSALGKKIKKIFPKVNISAEDILSVYNQYDWSNPGKGEVVRKLLAELQKNPSIYAMLDKSKGLRRKALANIDRDIAWAKKTGQAIRQDIQNMRKYIAEGGLKALQKALDDGAVLPAVVAGVIGLYLETEAQGGLDDA